jgi:hypothetical protein
LSVGCLSSGEAGTKKDIFTFVIRPSSDRNAVTIVIIKLQQESA